MYASRFCLTLLVSASFLCSHTARAITWPQPSAEELHMGAPAADTDANAVFLSYNEDDDDQMNVHTITVRLKVLTQAGVERFSDVEVGTWERHFSIENVEARTVHSDGQVVPFTGRPLVKMVRHRGSVYKATVFSMPDVQVGSIIEYHYRLAYDDHILLPAHWYVQQDAYMLRGHFTFKPFETSNSHFVTIDHGQISKGLMYTSWLPKSAVIVPDNHVGHAFYELTVTDVPALPDESALPPIDSLRYRMLFYYAAQLNQDSYWDAEGKFLSKDVNSFAAPGPKLHADVPGLFAATDTPDVKARKLYAAAMKIDNTDFTREHSQAEDAERGLHGVKTAEDIWARQRGSSDEIAMTYLAMLRVAGLHAYGMRVTNRDHNLFEPTFVDASQLNDLIVVAAIDGGEVYLDPGTRFCPYGQLAWRHSFARGLRQTENGTTIGTAAALAYADTTLQRVAMLGLDSAGEANGVVTLTYTGQEAMAIRQREVGEATADTRQRFEERLRSMLPGGMKLHVISMANLDDGEKPLQVVFGVSGAIGTPHGQRLLIAESLLRADEREEFTSATRKNTVYFHYPYLARDIVDLHLPPGMKLEAVPPAQKASALGAMAYAVQATSNGDHIRMDRTVAMNDLIVPVTDYPALRSFLGGLRSADENQLILVEPHQQGPTAGTGGGSAASH